ncbi:MAG: hypothetical protein EZS28_018306, partial [Streblomastix strix]
MVRILSPHLQVKIREMRNQGLIISAIAETLKLTRITVSKNAKKKKIIRQRYVTHKLGRGKVLTAAVIRKARKTQNVNHFRYARELTNAIGLNCSKRTSENLMHRLGMIFTKRKVKPYLSDTNQKKRKDFAERHLRDDELWRRTIFTDEKRFCLDGPDG